MECTTTLSPSRTNANSAASCGRRVSLPETVFGEHPVHLAAVELPAGVLPD